METEKIQAETREKIERLIREFLGGKSDFKLDRYLKTRGIENLDSINRTQREEFANDLIEKIIRPATSGGKTSIARVELMSILKIGVEPWKITADYVPSPREYLLEPEIKNEFRKLKHQAIYSHMLKYDLKNKTEIEPQTKKEILNSIITNVFGSMPKMTLTYTRLLFNQQPVEYVINKNLNAYLRPNEASDSAKSFMQLVNVLTMTKPEETQKAIDEELLSKKLMEDFMDTNQVAVRKLKNELSIDDWGAVTETKKQRLMQTIMSHYFGQMSEQFLRLECDKMSLEEDAATDRMRLINAIIHDCLRSSMNRDHAKKATEDLTNLINP
jgi:hypothetical protein